ncbi:integrase arm-type DNA-binding domain-containing protein [Geobacter sp.]|uniref:tyrosine-type recombinase/integrase n=1 Tax=Geobacter sp. TaxID=46610 RepID=UPI001AC9AC12|nr:integrase arm-type DNA-binding domain-containing protein [Geobacter sp.]CAG0958162.1 Prophage integrase IntA [Anaerolineales bacterium]
MPKRIQPLTDVQVKTAKPKEKDHKLADGGGLYLLVTVTGGKLWRCDYRYGGKRKTVAFGAYPAVSLADARQRREDAKKLLVNGVDPGDVKKAQKAAQGEQSANTFEVVAREWQGKYAKTWSAVHADTILQRLEKEVFPWLGAVDVAEIKAPALLAVLRRMEERGALDTAHRVRNHCSNVFRYAIATGRAERDPAADLRGALPPVKNGHHAAPTDPKQIAPLLRAMETFEGSFVVKCALLLTPLLFVRPGELRHAEWSEIDLDAAEWNIPAEKMKMKFPHLVPLPSQAVAILQELHALTGRGRYAFPCNRSTLRPMSENTVNAALRRLGFNRDEIVAHGFRAMARTVLDEVLGFRPDWIELQLAHAVKDPLGRAYNRTTHLAERKRMMQTWADYLDGLKTGAKVLPFKKSDG